MTGGGWSVAATREFDYRPGFRPRGLMPGAHKGLSGGAGHELRDRVSLLEHPDPRRLALRSSVQDPFRQLHVHIFNQHSRIPVYVVLDLSASMGCPGLERKWQLTMDFVEALAFSVWRSGDQFGLVPASESAPPALALHPTRGESLVNECIAMLREHVPMDTREPDLAAAAAALPPTPGMVFVVSDFHLSAYPLDSALANLTAVHDVVPVVVWDPAEALPQRRGGFLLMRDAETGVERHVWLRAGLRKKLERAAAERRQALLGAFRGHGLEPLFLGDGVEPDRINAYFAER